jgi:hypothetical protein
MAMLVRSINVMIIHTLAYIIGYNGAVQDQVGGLNPPGDCSTWILAKVRTKNMDWRLQDCPNSLSGIEKTCASDLLPNTVDNIFLAKYRTVAAHNRYQYIRSYESLVKMPLCAILRYLAIDYVVS